MEFGLVVIRTIFRLYTHTTVSCTYACLAAMPTTQRTTHLHHTIPHTHERFVLWRFINYSWAFHSPTNTPPGKNVHITTITYASGHRAAVKVMAFLLPHLRSGWAVDQAILTEEERLVVLRFGRDADDKCMTMDEVRRHPQPNARIVI